MKPNPKERPNAKELLQKYQDAELKIAISQIKNIKQYGLREFINSFFYIKNEDKFTFLESNMCSNLDQAAISLQQHIRDLIWGVFTKHGAQEINVNPLIELNLKVVINKCARMNNNFPFISSESIVEYNNMIPR